MRHVDGEDETEMKTSEEFYSFLNLNCKQTLKTIEQKKGKGVYERIFFYLNAKAVNHNLAEVKTVNGSSTFHEFNDTAQAGNVTTRVLSCHQCAPCKDFRVHECLNSDFCGALHGPVKVELAGGGRAEPVVLRTHLGRKGAELAEKVAVDDHIIVELEDSCRESFMIGEVLRIAYDHSGADSSSWMGTAKTYNPETKKPDRLVDVVKLEPTKPGSSIYVVCSDNEQKCFPVFIEDIRMHVDLDEVVGRMTRAATPAKRYTLSTTDFKLASEMCCRGTADQDLYEGRRQA